MDLVGSPSLSTPDAADQPENRAIAPVSCRAVNTVAGIDADPPTNIIDRVHYPFMPRGHGHRWLSFQMCTISIWLNPPVESAEDRAIRQRGEQLRRAVYVDRFRPSGREIKPGRRKMTPPVRQVESQLGSDS